MGQDNQPDDSYFMDLALELATKAEQKGEVPVGSVVVLEGDVIGNGYNSPIHTSDTTAHAEIVALREASASQANYRLTACTLYATLEPCLMCVGAMIHARIKRLVFACPDPKSGAAGSIYDIPADRRLNHQIEVVSGVREAESGQLLQSFFKQKREKIRH